MRTLIDSDDPLAAEAVDLFVYRIAREIGSLAAAIGGLDTLVFKAGLGQNAQYIRERAGAVAGWFAVNIDHKLNGRGDEVISLAGSDVDVLVIPTDEERAVGIQLLSVRPQALSLVP
ncbi:hypothetical protein X756_07135 [Mesorhizobium sp. LSHC412B00]|nr:hypothetical protein X756_07135 [Mesorhizobium sp. LSHC412B00]